ncbi:MAG: rod shape-determining protein [Planctomycetota bacterium]|nr:rod shape-determining protein [Planctomycetota bacterium]
MSDAVTFIGMDLGTFRTSVVSSNGRRAELETVVGWPKDHIAKSVLGKEVVFGSEVIDQRMALDVVRPFGHGVLKYSSPTERGLGEGNVEKHRDAARLLVEEIVSLVEPNRDGQVYAVVGVPSRATIVNKEFVIEATRSAFDAVMLVPEPFTVAYSADRLTETLVADIGAGTIDLCPMFGTFPDDNDQLTIPFGGDGVDEEFYNRIVDAWPDARISMKMAREIKEKHGFVGQSEERVIVSLPVKGRPTDLDVTDHLKQACAMLVPPIVECIVELVARFDPEIQRSLLSNILLGGGGSQLKGLTGQLEKALQPYGGGNVSRTYDSVFAGATGALKIAMGMPTEYWSRIQQTRTASLLQQTK